MIKIYLPNETSFATNGEKIVHPISAILQCEDGGDYYIEIEDLIENIQWYQQGYIISVPTPDGEQYFRCLNPKTNQRKIEVKAMHLSYDANNYIVNDKSAVDKTCNQALDYYNTNCDVSTPFTTLSDITTSLTTRMVRKTLYDICIELCATYGGHFVRDKKALKIMSSIGQDNGIVLSYAKNIKELTIEEDWSEVCTKILPYTTYNNGAITLDSIYVSNNTELYDTPYTKVVQFENELNIDDFQNESEFIAATKTWLATKANEYLNEHKFPNVNYELDALVEISGLGDTIHIKHPRCNVDILTNVIAYKYDCIREKITSIQFGNFRKELKNIAQEITESAVEETKVIVNKTGTALSNELKEATNRINNILGASYVIYEGHQILVVDKLPKETADYVIKISSGGIGFSSTGINGTFNSAWTIDGTLNMQNINVINFTANIIKGGVLTIGGTQNGSCELYDENNTLVATMDTNGITVYGNNGDYVKMNAEVGFSGYDSNNNRIFWADGQTFHMKNAEIENETRLAGKMKIVPIDTINGTGIGFVAME